MDAATPFAQMPATPEPIIAQVRRQLATEDEQARMASSVELDTIADRVVRELWGSRVKVFVPVLALREARELLHGQQP